MILSMHARMAECIDRRITWELPIGRSPDSRTETPGAFRRIAFPSFAAQWQLMRLGSITVAGAVLELPSWRLTSFP
jgi:hypothetical protein